MANLEDALRDLLLRPVQEPLRGLFVRSISAEQARSGIAALVGGAGELLAEPRAPADR